MSTETASSPRDIVTVNKVLQDPGKTLIDLSVSLSRSVKGKSDDDPPFLQPSPPYVRSHLLLCAFIVTFPAPGKARLSMYWQWNLRGSGIVWTNHISALPSILTNLVGQVKDYSNRIPYVKGWGRQVGLSNETYEINSDRLLVEYGIYQDQEGGEESEKEHVLLEKSKERRRLERALEVRLPPIDTGGGGWDIAITTFPPGNPAKPDWQCVVEKASINPSPHSRVTLRTTHARTSEDYVGVKLSIQRLAGGKALRLNGETLYATTVEDRDPTAFTHRTTTTLEHFATDAASAASTATADSSPSTAIVPPSPRTAARTSAAKESHQALITHLRRSYTSFLSFLQSPPAKWKSITEIRRVAVSSYAAIDSSTTPIYKFESTFVNTSVWDIFSVFVNSGARMVWDRASGLEQFCMLNEVETGGAEANHPIASDVAAGEGITSFWAAKWKGTWPIAPRDAVLLRTAYKSPTSIHVFYTSVPPGDKEIWRHVKDSALPNGDPNVVRIQVDLLAIAIDQISPTTTVLTLVDQTNPKGWSRSGYSTTAAAVACLGDFGELKVSRHQRQEIEWPLVLKHGAPPVLTRLSNARVISTVYDHNPGGLYKLEYESSSRIEAETEGVPNIECVLRCDVKIWSSSGLTLTIHPPDARISVLVRHRLSDRGSGCWITIEHSQDEMEALEDEGNHNRCVISVTVQRGSPDGVAVSSKDKHSIWINGSKVKVDVEELKDAEVRELSSKKRIRTRALLLDQPDASQQSLHRSRSSLTSDRDSVLSEMPLPVSALPSKSLSQPLSTQPPLYYALEALSWLQALHADLSMSEFFEGASDWSILSYAENNSPIRISKKTVPKLSVSQPLFRVERNFPGITADQVLPFVTSLSTIPRTAWDDRLSSIEPIHRYNHLCSTSTWISKPSFPLRSRIAYVATTRAHFLIPAASGSSKGTSAVSLLASASFPLEALEVEASSGEVTAKNGLDREMLNPAKLTEGKVYLEGWILETHEAPSDEEDEESSPRTKYTRCSFFTCSDLPTFASGTFGLVNVRTRLSLLFDSLEKNLRNSSPMASLHFPVTPLQVEGSLQRHEGKSERWQIVPAIGSVTVVYTEPESTAVLIRKLARHSSQTTPLQTNASADDSPESGRSSLARTPTKLDVLSKPTHPVLRQVNSSPSLSRLRSEPPPAFGDLKLAEIVIMRNSSIAGFNIEAVACPLHPEGGAMPSDPTLWKPLLPLPFKLLAFPMTLPASQASRFLLRLILPSAQYTSPFPHPLGTPKSSQALPLWFRKLSDGDTLLHISILPVKVLMQVEGRPASPLKLMFNGNAITLASDNDSMMVARVHEEDEDEVQTIKITRCARFRHYPRHKRLIANLIELSLRNQA